MRQIKVFIVDDDKDFAESLADILIRQGYEVELAGNGEEAVEKHRQQDFDITFMDVKMPRKNGLESFLEIRSFKPYVKVVMMTAYSVQQILDQALENGVLGILYKPLDMNKIFDMLNLI